MGQRFDTFSYFDGTEMIPVTQITWSDYWRGIVPDGIVAKYQNEMRVYGNSTGMVVYVESGACMVDNHRGVVSSEKQINIATADLNRPRIDVIVARVVYGNENESYMELDVLTGTPEASPVAPEITQSTGSTYEIKLAEVMVEAGAYTIKASDVTDCRNRFTMGQNYFTFMNADTAVLEKGMLVKVSNQAEEAVERAALEDVVAGVVEAETIAPGSRGLINTKAGEIAEIKCDEGAVAIGDVLIPSTTILGYGHPGGVRYSGGIALQAKEAGAVGNVKSLLTIFSKLPTQNKWYLVNDLTESDVLAAFQFVGRHSMADALLNLNESEYPYALTQTSNEVTWSAERGFYIPNKYGEGLKCPDIFVYNQTPLAAIFGYNGMLQTTGDSFAGGITMHKAGSVLELRGYTSSGWYTNAISCNCRSTDDTALIKSTSTGKTPGTGVVSCDWGDTNKIYFDGYEVNTESAGRTETGSAQHYTNVFGQHDFQNTYETASIFASFYITAAVLYKTALTASDHYELYNRIRGLGGVG